MLAGTSPLAPEEEEDETYCSSAHPLSTASESRRIRTSSFETA